MAQQVLERDPLFRRMRMKPENKVRRPSLGTSGLTR